MARSYTVMRGAGLEACGSVATIGKPYALSRSLADSKTQMRGGWCVVGCSRLSASDKRICLSRPDDRAGKMSRGGRENYNSVRLTRTGSGWCQLHPLLSIHMGAYIGPTEFSWSRRGLSP